MSRTIRLAVFLLLAVLLLSVVSVLFGSRFPVEMNRYVYMDSNTGEVSVVVKGMYPMIISSEGAFPRWSHCCKITLHDKRLLTNTDVLTLSEKDFSTQYGEICIGEVVLDLSNRKAVVDVVFSKKYKHLRCNGSFVMKDDLADQKSNPHSLSQRAQAGDT